MKLRKYVESATNACGDRGGVGESRRDRTLDRAASGRRDRGGGGGDRLRQLCKTGMAARDDTVGERGADDLRRRAWGGTVCAAPSNTRHLPYSPRTNEDSRTGGTPGTRAGPRTAGATGKALRRARA